MKPTIAKCHQGLGGKALLLATAVLGLAPAAGLAQNSLVGDVPDLPDEHAAIARRGERLSFPSPAEYFRVLAKATNPRWRTWYRELDAVPPTDRSKVSAGLGFLVAEAHLAAMARDEQRLHNVCLELGAHMKILGFKDALAPVIANIEARVLVSNWNAVHMDLEILAAEAVEELLRQRDEDSARLATLGLWVRVMHVGSGVVAGGEVEDLSLAAGGEGLPQRLAEIAAGISEKAREGEPLALIMRQGEKVARIWAREKFEAGRVFTVEEVKDTHARCAAIVAHLSAS